MRLPKITAEVVFVGALLVALIYAVFFWHIKEADAQVIVYSPEYRECVDTCLAYNGYSTETYNFCTNACLYPDEVVVSGGVGVWINGTYYPHNYWPPFIHREPRHDHDGDRHNHDRHDHHGRR